MSTDDRMTAPILETLGWSVVPWHHPWNAQMPRHLVSHQPYRGINGELTTIAGFASPICLIVNQANALSSYIQKGGERCLLPPEHGVGSKAMPHSPQVCAAIPHLHPRGAQTGV
jgi:hypothetical protein